MEWVVTVAHLRLRDHARPGATEDALGRELALLVAGDRFRRLGNSARPGWWRVEVWHGGKRLRGEINAAPDFVAPAPVASERACARTTGNACSGACPA